MMLARSTLLLVPLLYAGAEWGRPSAPPNGSDVLVTLPVEVIGSDGYIASVTIPRLNTSSVTHLYLRIHRPVYRNVSDNYEGDPDPTPTFGEDGAKASVRLNGLGNWVDLRYEEGSTEVQCIDNHENYYGCLNGSYHTVRVKIEIGTFGTPLRSYPDLQRNFFEFRFNETDGFTSGYRVLELNLLNSSETPQIGQSAFSYVNPALWQVPTGGDAGRGDILWHQVDSLFESPLTFSSQTRIHASCSNCHAHDGRDLRYFNYSNRSIQERAKFHGLNDQQAKDIAAYIRSPLYSAHRSTNGRPWEPPYQPGDGLDGRPVTEWSAGAGLNAVLDEQDGVIGGDLAMASYINTQTVDEAYTLNVRQAPIAMQFPDWNAWLPEVYPRDIPGWYGAFVDMSGNPNEDIVGWYNSLINSASIYTHDGPGAPLKSVVRDMERFSAAGMIHFLGPVNYSLLDAATPGPLTRSEVEEASRSVRHWTAVKLWEVSEQFDLEDDAVYYYSYNPSANQENGLGESRSWLGRRRQIFDLSPHLATQGAGFSQRPNFTYQHPLVGKYFSTSWYQLQMTINAGNRPVGQADPIMPVDWNYQPMHIDGLFGSGGPAHPYRAAETWAKLFQAYFYTGTQSLNTGSRTNVTQAFARQAHPGRWAGFDLFMTEGEVIDDGQMPRGNLPNSNERVALFNMLLNSYMDAVEEYGTAFWIRDPGNGQYPEYYDAPLWEPQVYELRMICQGVQDWRKCFTDKHFDGRYADLWYAMIPQFCEWGISTGNIVRMAQWGASMWPGPGGSNNVHWTNAGLCNDRTASAGSVLGLPEAVSLSPSHPNPFATTSTLTYGLPEAGPARLELYDLLGRRVAVLMDEEQEAGWHTATVNASTLATGAYVCRLQAGGVTRTQKVLVLR